MRTPPPCRVASLALFAAVSLASCRHESSGEAVSNLNGSELDFGSFRRKFNRTYESGGEEFERRRFYFKFSPSYFTVMDFNLLELQSDERSMGESDPGERPLVLLLLPSHQEGKAAERFMVLNSFSPDERSAKYGVNQFSDLSQEEFSDLYLRAVPDRSPRFSGQPAPGLPARFDWRDEAAVAPVQDQLAVRFTQCGSCWAFGVVGAVQSVHAIVGAPLQQLSVQQVLDCSYQNKGCDGGSPLSALSWLQQTRLKLVTQADYPYLAKTEICRFFPPTDGVVALRNFTAHDFSGREDAMRAQLVRRGPLVAVVDAVSWQDYLGGIIQHHCSSRRSNHAVLVVGYDATGTIPYWIVQNSWGPTWGNEGYVYIKMGGDICGIADSVAAVSV